MYIGEPDVQGHATTQAADRSVALLAGPNAYSCSRYALLFRTDDRSQAIRRGDVHVCLCVCVFVRGRVYVYSLHALYIHVQTHISDESHT